MNDGLLVREKNLLCNRNYIAAPSHCLPPDQEDVYLYTLASCREIRADFDIFIVIKYMQTLAVYDIRFNSQEFSESQ